MQGRKHGEREREKEKERLAAIYVLVPTSVHGNVSSHGNGGGLGRIIEEGRKKTKRGFLSELVGRRGGPFEPELLYYRSRGSKACCLCKWRRASHSTYVSFKGGQTREREGLSFLKVGHRRRLSRASSSFSHMNFTCRTVSPFLVPRHTRILLTLSEISLNSENLGF